MPKNCPNCVRALEELVQEIRKMTTKNYLAPKVAAKLEHELQEAIAESKKDIPDLKSIWRCCMNQLARWTGPNPAAFRLPRSSPAYPRPSYDSKPES